MKRYITKALGIWEEYLGKGIDKLKETPATTTLVDRLNRMVMVSKTNSGKARIADDICRQIERHHRVGYITPGKRPRNTNSVHIYQKMAGKQEEILAYDMQMGYRIQQLRAIVLGLVDFDYIKSLFNQEDTRPDIAKSLKLDDIIRSYSIPGKDRVSISINRAALRKRLLNIKYEEMLQTSVRLMVQSYEIWPGKLQQAATLRVAYGLYKTLVNELTLRYWSWACNIATGYYTVNKLHGSNLRDLCSAALSGLHRAAERYDPRREILYKHYATSWVEQRLRLVIANESRLLRIPISARYFYRTRWVNKQDEKSLKDLCDINAKADAVYNYMSLDTPDEEDAAPLYKSLSGPDGVARTAEYSEMKAQIHEAIKRCLTAREARVVTLRFGLEDGQEVNLEDVGSEFGLTRERIRQIQRHAITKLHAKCPQLAEHIFL